MQKTIRSGAWLRGEPWVGPGPPRERESTGLHNNWPRPNSEKSAWLRTSVTRVRSPTKAEFSLNETILFVILHRVALSVFTLNLAIYMWPIFAAGWLRSEEFRNHLIFWIRRHFRGVFDFETRFVLTTSKYLIKCRLRIYNSDIKSFLPFFLYVYESELHIYIYTYMYIFINTYIYINVLSKKSLIYSQHNLILYGFSHTTQC